MNWRTRRAERLGGADYRIDTPFADHGDPYATPHDSNPFADDAMGYTPGYAPERTRERTMSPHPARRTSRVQGGPVAMLHELRAHVAPALLQRGYGDHRQNALQLANAVLGVFGLRMPNVTWTQGQDAYALGNQIVIGVQLARSLSLPALTQLLLHEAGHVHEGHADIATGLFLRSLVEQGHLSQSLYNAMMRDEERVADIYAAIGAWMFDPSDRPGLATWLDSLGHPTTDTHPSSRERSMLIQAIVRALDDAAFNNSRTPWAFGDPFET